MHDTAQKAPLSLKHHGTKAAMAISSADANILGNQIFNSQSAAKPDLRHTGISPKNSQMNLVGLDSSSLVGPTLLAGRKHGNPTSNNLNTAEKPGTNG